MLSQNFVTRMQHSIPLSDAGASRLVARIARPSRGSDSLPLSLVTILQQEATLAECTPAQHQPRITRRAFPKNRRKKGRAPAQCAGQKREPHVFSETWKPVRPYDSASDVHNTSQYDRAWAPRGLERRSRHGTGRSWPQVEPTAPEERADSVRSTERSAEEPSDALDP